MSNKILGIIFLLFVSFNTFSNSFWTGPSAVQVGQVATYTYDDGVIYTMPEWYVGNGTKLGSQVTGSTYSVTIQWTSPGTVNIQFAYDIDALVSQKQVTIAIPAPTALGATNISTNSLTANWSEDPDATSYRLDVATSISFNNKVSGYNNLVVNGTSQNVTGLLANLTYYYRVRSVHSVGTSPNSNSITTVTSPTSPSALAASLTTANSFTANWQSVAGATGYRLDISTDIEFTSYLTGYNDLALTATSQNISGLAAGTIYYYRVRAINSYGSVSVNSSKISVLTRPIAPTALPASNITATTFTANWDNPTGTGSYRLDVCMMDPTFFSFLGGYANLPVTGNSKVVNIPYANTPYFYRIREVNSSGASENSQVISLTSTGSSTPTPPTGGNVDGDAGGSNYIRQVTILKKGITNETLVVGAALGEKIVKYDYFDGLGRQTQSVQKQQSPNQLDFVQPIVYDQFGREHRKYLPITTGENGLFKPGIIDVEGKYIGVAANFYNNNSAGKIAQDNQPYSETVFESSPLSRPLKEYGAGAAWSLSQGNKFIEFKYNVNVHSSGASDVAEKIISWKIISDMPVRETSTSGYTEIGGYYSSGQLFVDIIIDEQNNSVREYRNKTGQVVLKKVQAITNSNNLNSIADWAMTYYIYDDFGNLRFVLPPELTKLIHANDSNVPNATDLANWAFQYKYDTRNRMIEKQGPGSTQIYLVYDNRDRLVLTQDGNQRAGATNAIKYWTFTKYDEFNRPILTGIKDTTTAVQLTQEQMQVVVDGHFAKPSSMWGETYIGNLAGNVHGYTNRAYPVCTGTAAGVDPFKYLTVKYYDNYSFRNLWMGVYSYVNESLNEVANGITYVQPEVESTRIIGNVAGTKVKVLDGGVAGGYTWLKSVNYYDDKYRVVQTIGDNYKGGTDRVTNVYDFTGKILKAKTFHEERDVIWKDLSNMNIVGNQLVSKNYAAAAASVQKLPAGQDGWIESTVAEINGTSARWIGLSENNIDATTTTIDYAIYLTVNSVIIYEKGVYRGYFSLNIVSGDIIGIERVGTAIKYKRNGTVFYTSPTPSTTSLLVDVYTTGATIVNIRTSFSATSHNVTRRFEYDHAGRLLKTWHKLDNELEILLAKNEYNELGQLVDKKLHSTVSSGVDARQSIDYRYNIRGWLTKMNESDLSITEANEPRDFFGMKLLYNEEDVNVGNAQLYNGNISAMKWSNQLGLGSIKENAHTYSYDPLNRILGSTFKERISSWSTPANNAFAETGFTYDLNGNIKTLQRNDKRASGWMDNIVYDYGTGQTLSNKLVKVTDNGDDFAGFLDGNPGTTTDYTYDANGNMITDGNKGITTPISYNYLNLPEVVLRGGLNSVRYIYDVTGRKLTQVVYYNNQSQKQTDYSGEFQYENDELQFVMHEEGRIVLTKAKTIFTHNGEVTSNVTAATSTIVPVTVNGSTYIRATANGATTKQGIFPIGGILAVQAGEQYRIRAKGYVNGGYAVHLNIKVNGTDLSWPGASLPFGSATEGWVEQIVTIPTGNTTLQAGVVWNTVVNGLQFYLNDFEIVKLETQNPEYQYNLKDHLGNVRLTFTTKREVETVIATMETANVTAEQGKFLYYDEAVKINSTLFDHTNSGTTNYSTRLSGNTNEKYGLAKSLSVMPGDTLNLEVFAKYVDSNSSNWNQALIDFMAAIANGTAPTGTFVDGGAAGSIGNQTFPFMSTLVRNNDNGTGPKAYLNYILFDKNFNYKTGGFRRISSTSRETGTDVAHERLAFDNLVIAEPGYIYIYLSNENETPVDVFFDDFRIEHIKSPIIQTDDYYPFGLVFNSYNRENSTPNDYKYNSKEEQTELGLGWLDFGARMHQPEIGRFFNQDRFAEKYYSLSPYQYGGLNPVNFIDINGDSLWINYRGTNVLYQNGGLYNKDGTAYAGQGAKTDKSGNVTGYKGFLGQAFNALNQLGTSEGQAGTSVISELQSSSNNFTIADAANNMRAPGENEFVADNRSGAYAIAMLDAGQGRPQAGGSGGTIYWNPTGGAVNELGGGVGTRPTTNLGHEMFHGYDANRGLLDNRPLNGLKRDEWRAVYFENQMRARMGLPFRESYSTRAGQVRVLSPVTIFMIMSTVQLPTNVSPPSISWLQYIRFR